MSGVRLTSEKTRTRKVEAQPSEIWTQDFTFEDGRLELPADENSLELVVLLVPLRKQERSRRGSLGVSSGSRTRPGVAGIPDLSVLSSLDTTEECTTATEDLQSIFSSGAPSAEKARSNIQKESP